jgi:uncharacterized protein YxeA
MNNHDDGNNENNTNSIDIMTITVTTVMAMVIIIQYLFVYILTQQLNGQVQNRQEYTKNDVNTYKQTKIKYEQNTRRNKSKILQFN